MHFRIRDLAAERCVWSVPPIDTVPVKLRCRMLDVRAFDVHDKMVGRAHSAGEKLADIIKQLFADPHARYLHVHFATDDAYAARVDRFSSLRVPHGARHYFKTISGRANPAFLSAPVKRGRRTTRSVVEGLLRSRVGER